MSRDAAELSVLFVCLGNICRSPTAEGVFRAKLAEAGLDERVHVDSAGTGAYHLGEAPDPRARSAAERRGYDLEGQRGRQVSADDLARFDYVLAMDGSNLHALERIRPGTAERFLDYHPALAGADVPDPYAGGREGFERVLDLIEGAADGLLADVRERLGAQQAAS